MPTPFKMKGWSPFKNNKKKSEKEKEQEKKEKERQRKINKAIRKGNAPPVTKETIKYYLDAVRGSRDKSV